MTNDKMFTNWNTGRYCLKQEDYEILISKYDKLLREVMYYKVCRALKPSELKELMTINDNIGFQPLTNPNCATCVMNMCKRIGNLYFEKMEREVKKAVKKADKDTTKQRIKQEKKEFNERDKNKRLEKQKQKDDKLHGIKSRGSNPT